MQDSSQYILLILQNDGTILDNVRSAVKTEAIKAIREMSGMNRKDFAKWLNIPYRTMSDWEHGLRVMPDYVLELIAYKVRMELVEKRGG